MPYRNELIQLLITIAQYTRDSCEIVEKVHHLFERLLPYMDRPTGITQWDERDFDNFKFIVHELFLYALAIFIKYERFDYAQAILDQQYYSQERIEQGKDPMISFIAFRRHMISLAQRNQRLKLNMLSVRAAVLKTRCSGIGIDFRYIMQADFVAFMRAEIDSKGIFGGWCPETLILLGFHHSAFEIFARSTSLKYFQRVKGLLSINSPKDMEPLFKMYKLGERKLPQWQFDSFDPAQLMSFDKLAILP